METTNESDSTNKSNLFITDVLKRTELLQNLEQSQSVTQRESGRNKNITFNKLVDFVNEVPQEMDDKIRYVLLSGWERELILQADELLPINPQDRLVTRLKKPGSDHPITPHGDIDYLWMVPESLITRDLWEKYHTDGGKSTLPVRLLYYNDFSRRGPGTNQPDSGALEKYCCRVIVNGKEFIVPKPELTFLEYAYHKPEDQNKVPWANLLLDLDKKYSFELDLLEEARLKLINLPNEEQRDQFKYLMI